jgi:hypothetical protein
LGDQTPGVIAFTRIRAEAHEVMHLAERCVTSGSGGQISLLQHLIDLPEDSGLRLGNMSTPGVAALT